MPLYWVIAIVFGVIIVLALVLFCMYWKLVLDEDFDDEAWVAVFVFSPIWVSVLAALWPLTITVVVVASLAYPIMRKIRAERERVAADERLKAEVARRQNSQSRTPGREYMRKSEWT